MPTNLNLLILLLLFFAVQSKGDSTGSVVFFDGSNPRFIRSRPIAMAGEGESLSTDEVAATVSVLLGFAPPASLPVDSSLKLNEVLFPNPFERPRAVLLLEVLGTKDPLLSIAHSKSNVGSTFSSSVLGLSNSYIQLTDEDEVSILPLDEALGVECDAACIDEELHNLAQWLAGTYVDTTKSLHFPLASGASLYLHMDKEADRHFALSLVSLFKSTRNAVEVHEDIAGSSISPAELLLGRFTGIQALKEEYGSGDIFHQGIELFQTALTKSFELLMKSYGGKIVGVVLSDSRQSPDMGAVLDVKFSERQSRWLEQVSPPNATTIAEIILVRLTLAWLTGIILLVSTLIGIYYLLYMPITRDTLLYSNVKLD